MTPTGGKSREEPGVTAFDTLSFMTVIDTLPPHHYPFDPTYGYSLDTLLEVPAPPGPDDFEAFWRDTYDQARALPLNLAHRESTLSTEDVEVREVEFDAFGGVRLGGWFTRPRQAVITRGLVVGHGYGGREAPEVGVGEPPAAMLFPCARGFHRSAVEGIPDTGGRHVLHGIEHRDTYIHRGCAADLWAAASALIELAPGVADRLHYRGGSYGGGIGALALPWDDRFAAAHLEVPSFGNHPLRVTLPCTGSGEAVRLMHQRRPGVLDVLQYFDAATAARYLRTRTHFGCALFDPAVPPPGQFAVYNGAACKKRLFVRSAGHFEYPEQAAESARMEAELVEWFSEI